MNINEILNFNKSKNICDICSEPLGELQENRGTFFCYNCNGYIKMDLANSLHSIHTKLENLREKFKEEVINGHTDRYFCNYLTLGESLYSTDSLEYCAEVPDSNEEMIHINFIFFVVANLALKWILKDLNFKVNGNNDYKQEVFGIPLEWQSIFCKKVYIENNLGFYIKKDDKEHFFFTQKLDNYHKSLNQFGLVEPTHISEEKMNRIVEDILEKEKDVDYIKRIINLDLPLTFVCMSYNQYPNMKDRIFSFEDILYDPSVIQIISDLHSYYRDKRPKTPEECDDSKKYFIVNKMQELKTELNHIKWDNDLRNHIIASQFNPMSIPLLILYKNDIVITPTRLKIAYEMMFERFVHNTISSVLSRVFELEFQKHSRKIIKDSINIIDPITGETWENIIDKKNSNFEADIIGCMDDYIFVIECKSFHPAPFYHLMDARNRRKEQFNHSITQFKSKIKPWLIKCLAKKPKNGYIKINCRKIMKDRKSKNFTMNFPLSFHGIDDDHIIGIYLTQLNETFNNSSNIIQINYEELEEFIKLLK